MGPDGKSKGAAFVTFAYSENAVQAIDQLNGYIFPNSTRPVNVSLAAKQNFGKNIPNLNSGFDFTQINNGYGGFELGAEHAGNDHDVDKFLI